MSVDGLLQLIPYIYIYDNTTGIHYILFISKTNTFYMS